jgi:hypothetical protein
MSVFEGIVVFRNLLTRADFFWPLFAITLTCKLTLAYGYYPNLFGGSDYEMGRAVHSVYAGNGMADVYGPASGPSAHLAPLYVYYLAGLMWLCGTGAPWVRAFQLLSLVAASALVAFLPGLARATRLPVAAGMAAALFLTVSPYTIYYEKLGIGEQTFAALGLLLTFRRIVRPDFFGESLPASAVTGAGLGMLILLSPSVMPGIVGVLLVGYFVSHCHPRRSLNAAVILSVCVLMLLPWVYRNYRDLGGLVPVRSNFGLEFYIGNYDGADGFTFGSGTSIRHPSDNPDELAHYKEVGELAYMRQRTQTALAWAQDNPASFAWLTWMRFRLYWFPTFGEDVMLKRTLWFGALGIGSFAGILCLFWARHPYRWHYLFLLFGPSLVYMITHVNPRYRYPTLWVSALLTAYAVDAVGRLIARRMTANLGDSPHVGTMKS